MPAEQLSLTRKLKMLRSENCLKKQGLKAEHIELLGVYSGKDMHNTYPNGDDVSNVDIVYICKQYSGELKRQESEVEDIRFFAVDELPDNIFKPNLPTILDLAKLRKSM
jgi:isopentenyldiphosphate isomerase